MTVEARVFGCGQLPDIGSQVHSSPVLDEVRERGVGLLRHLRRGGERADVSSCQVGSAMAEPPARGAFTAPRHIGRAPKFSILAFDFGPEWPPFHGAVQGASINTASLRHFLRKPKAHQGWVV